MRTARTVQASTGRSGGGAPRESRKRDKKDATKDWMRAAEDRLRKEEEKSMAPTNVGEENDEYISARMGRFQRVSKSFASHRAIGRAEYEQEVWERCKET